MEIRSKVDDADEMYININDFLLFLMKKALSKTLSDSQREAHKLVISHLELLKANRGK